MDQDLSYEEKPVQVLDRKDKVLRTKTVPLVKVLWRNSKSKEATWELEAGMRERDIASSSHKFRGRNSCKEGRVVTPRKSYSRNLFML